jgi:ABC-type amino acid transport substrate-binding protein
VTRAALALALLALAGCGGTGSERAATTTATAVPSVTTVAAGELIRGGHLQACAALSPRPFAFERDGKLVGLEIDLLGAIAQRLDLAVSWRVVPRAQLEPALLGGRCDVIAGRLVVTYKGQASKAMLAYLRIGTNERHENIGLAFARLRSSLWFGLRGAIMEMQNEGAEQRLLERWPVAHGELLTLP